MAAMHRFLVAAATGVILVGMPAADSAKAQVTPAEAAPGPSASSISSAPAPAAALLLSQRTATYAVRADHADDVAALKAFYAEPAAKMLWVENGHFNARALRVMAEVAKAADWGLDAASFTLPPTPAAGGDDAAIAAEARLSLAVLKYARHARGGRFDPSKITEALDRTPNIMPPSRVLAGLAETEEPDAYLRKLHPQHPQFEKLRQLYLAARAGSLEPSAAPAPVVEADVEPQRKGRKRKAAAVPAPAPSLTAERVLVNMEQWRWMPDQLGSLHVMVNIPEFELKVVKNGAMIYSERVVTGTASNPTPIFSKDMQTVVFQPGWGVPSGIKVKELLPGLLAGRDSVSGRGLVVRYNGREVPPMSINWRSTDIRRISIVQPPGPRNALGQVKFLFPNKHDVYMHDTPSKSLFNASTRAFSHGCVRVRNPMKFAELLFAETGGWAPARVASLSRGKPENEVPVPGHVEVHLTYFTVVVDDAGKPIVLRDIYGHEARIKAGIEGRAEMVAKKSDDLGAIRQSLVQRTRVAREGRGSREQRRGNGGSGGGGGGLFGWF